MTTTAFTPRNVQFKQRPSLVDTLKSLEIGVAYLFKVRDSKVYTTRATASKLQDQGYLFTISEEGRIDDYIVTRLK